MTRLRHARVDESHAAPTRQPASSRSRPRPARTRRNGRRRGRGRRLRAFGAATARRQAALAQAPLARAGSRGGPGRCRHRWRRRCGCSDADAGAAAGSGSGGGAPILVSSVTLRDGASGFVEACTSTSVGASADADAAAGGRVARRRPDERASMTPVRRARLACPLPREREPARTATRSRPQTASSEAAQPGASRSFAGRSPARPPEAPRRRVASHHRTPSRRPAASWTSAWLPESTASRRTAAGRSAMRKTAASR